MGFKAHFDTHDVFVLQIEGCKRWTLYDTPIELPLRGQEYKSSTPLHICQVRSATNLIWEREI